MTVLLTLFLAIATLLWLSVFGYVLVLGAIAVIRRRHAVRDPSTFPDVAIVITTLNDEDLIIPKLTDMQRTDYPRDRMTVIVVDGGSVDRTTELVRQEIANGEPIQLVCPEGVRGKTDQIIHAMGQYTQDIVVVTNVDSVLEPSCIRELIIMLEKDHHTAVAGATVQPDTAFLEERIYWWFLNHLWWLEGEALSSAGVSAVCFAFKRDRILPLARDAKADDIHVALAAGARGARARISLSAHATEVRVPHSAREFVRFRHRRGKKYLSELRFSRYAHAPMGWHLVRFMRLWHFLVTPKVAVGLAVSAFVLLGTPHWPWLLLAFAAFAVPALAALFASTTLAGDRRRWWRLSLAAGRLVTLTVISMLTLNYHRPEQASPCSRE